MIRVRLGCITISIIVPSEAVQVILPPGLHVLTEASNTVRFLDQTFEARLRFGTVIVGGREPTAAILMSANLHTYGSASHT